MKKQSFCCLWLESTAFRDSSLIMRPFCWWKSTTLRKGGRAGDQKPFIMAIVVNLPPPPKLSCTFRVYYMQSPLGKPHKAGYETLIFPEGFLYVWGGCPRLTSHNMEGVEDAHNVWSIWAIFLERPTNVWSTQLAVNSSGIVHQQKSALKKLQIQRLCCRKNCPVLCEKSRTPVTWPNCFDRILGNRILEQDV